MNMSFCTDLMGMPFFSWAIPIYGILPYSMILQMKTSITERPFTFFVFPGALLRMVSGLVATII